MTSKTFYHLLYFIALAFLATGGCKNNAVTPQQPKNDSDVVKDIDGNVYHTVKIGIQTWMVENLRVTHYQNGDPIPYSSTDITKGAYCNYNNDTTLAAVYGRLYNYAATSFSPNICPAGWHLPTDNEWTQLELDLGGDNIIGGDIKEAGTTHWKAPNTGATNNSRLNGLPAGHCDGGIFYELGEKAFFWASPLDTRSRGLDYSRAQILTWINDGSAFQFVSVRCLKDY
jgi:uncharacterized protein (TIGR02145 family)